MFKTLEVYQNFIKKPPKTEKIAEPNRQNPLENLKF
ncbi:hypothetical protein HPGAM_03465 [Helicobacter pylori Gambia94/24]|nr:hypothetical protein HPGAM_03465 [Helicobacter pylori Gambia94/24]